MIHGRLLDDNLSHLPVNICPQLMIPGLDLGWLLAQALYTPEAASLSPVTHLKSPLVPLSIKVLTKLMLRITIITSCKLEFVLVNCS